MRPRLLPLLALLATGCAAALAGGTRPIRLFLAGDSTLAEKLDTRRPETGWGEHLQRHFRAGEVHVVNRARNGRSTRTFLSEGLWRSITDSLAEGDWVLIQFGHNDASPDKPDRYATPAEYRANLERFVADVRARGANPLLMTPVPRRRFDSLGVVRASHGEYPAIVREIAAAEGVPLVDMELLGTRALQSSGPDASRRLFLQLAPGEHPNYPAGVTDNTHFSPDGAALMAELFVAELRRSGLSLAARLAR